MIKNGLSTFDRLLFGAAAVGQMERLWKTELEWLFLWLAVLMTVVAIACYVTEKIRPKTVQKERLAGQWLSKCRDLHSQGELSDEEFRTIKTTFAAQLRDELSDNGRRVGTDDADHAEMAGSDDFKGPARHGFWKRLQDVLRRGC
jgi:uncharacterized membrane protein